MYLTTEEFDLIVKSKSKPAHQSAEELSSAAKRDSDYFDKYASGFSMHIQRLLLEQLIFEWLFDKTLDDALGFRFSDNNEKDYLNLIKSINTPVREKIWKSKESPSGCYIRTFKLETQGALKDLKPVAVLLTPQQYVDLALELNREHVYKQLDALLAERSNTGLTTKA